MHYLPFYSLSIRNQIKLRYLTFLLTKRLTEKQKEDILKSFNLERLLIFCLTFLYSTIIRNLKKILGNQNLRSYSIKVNP